ncbi:MAG TPA: DUF58 domain-containing protein [Fibrobacteraceae bacterium]|nr:DUF58 domain-containing protein [Fibrobacteraceae bacterium]
MLDKEVLKTVRRIEISLRSTINSVMAGAYHSSFKGNGMEFSEVREYVPGDDIRTIDWNVTARTGHPYVKKFVEERELTVMLVVDASSSAEFGSANEMKGQVMATISALLAFAAIRNNDKVGLLIFTDEVELFIPPAKGRRHVLRVVRELLVFQPKGKRTNLHGALDYLGGIVRRRAIVVVLSDFQDKDFELAFKMLRRRHEIIAVGVVDPRELELPDVGFVELEDPETGDTLLVDTGDPEFREAFRREAKLAGKQLQTLFQKMAIDYVRIVIAQDTQSTVAPLVEYFRRRSKEVRRAG